MAASFRVGMVIKTLLYEHGHAGTSAVAHAACIHGYFGWIAGTIQGFGICSGTLCRALFAKVTAAAWAHVDMKVIAMGIVGFRSKRCPKYTARGLMGIAQEAPLVGQPF